MRRQATLIVAMFFVVLSLKAQTSVTNTFIDFGPKFLGGATGLFSNVSFDDEKYVHHPSSLGFGGGFKFAFDFNTHIAVVGEALYMTNKQVFDVHDKDLTGEVVNYSKTIRYDRWEFPVMFRYNSETMRYVEGGIVFGVNTRVDETINAPYADENSIQGSVADHYVKNTTGLVIGSGGYLWGSGNFGISTGLRLRYDLGDFSTVSSGDRFENAPLYGQDSRVSGDIMPLSLMFVMEFNYDLGFMMAKSSCGNRRKVIIGN